MKSARKGVGDAPERDAINHNHYASGNIEEGFFDCASRLPIAGTRLPEETERGASLRMSNS